jgi:hypothetical protein
MILVRSSGAIVVLAHAPAMAPLDNDFITRLASINSSSLGYALLVGEVSSGSGIASTSYAYQMVNTGFLNRMNDAGIHRW